MKVQGSNTRVHYIQNKTYHYFSSIARFAQEESAAMARPTPIISAFSAASRASAADASVIPPVRMTGISTAVLLASVDSLKYPCSFLYLFSSSVFFTSITHVIVDITCRLPIVSVCSTFKDHAGGNSERNKCRTVTIQQEYTSSTVKRQIYLTFLIHRVILQMSKVFDICCH